MEIKRYELELQNDGGARMDEIYDGDYILHSDHIAAMAELEAENKSWEELCNKKDFAYAEKALECLLLQAKLDKAIEALNKVLPALRIANEDTTDEYYINVKKDAEKTLAEISETK